MEVRQFQKSFGGDYEKVIQKYIKLAALWKELIELDDRNWTSKNWKNYANKWNDIKKQAKRQLEEVGANRKRRGTLKKVETVF